MRDLIAYKVGGVVYALGGDSETGNELLCEKQPFTLGSHKTRGVRLPKGSRASDMSALKFNQTVETIYGKVRGVSRSSNNWQTHMIALDHLLKPQEKPIWTSTTRPRASPLCRSPARDRRRAAEGRQDGLLADTLSGSCHRWNCARS